jgi:hypothetical protein
VSGSALARRTRSARLSNEQKSRTSSSEG